MTAARSPSISAPLCFLCLAYGMTLAWQSLGRSYLMMIRLQVLHIGVASCTKTTSIGWKSTKLIVLDCRFRHRHQRRLQCVDSFLVQPWNVLYS